MLEIFRRYKRKKSFTFHTIEFGKKHKTFIVQRKIFKI